jgi:arylsulfatase A-like enzyme/Tfp pilus assembly protein PilF
VGRRLVVRLALLCAVLIPGLGGLGCGAAPLQRVVLVSIDTLRADHVGCYGARAARTPTLDGLAARGVRFAAAISPVPLTLPSHTSLMTGLDPPHHGVRHNSVFRLAGDVPTVAERMQAAGFATAAFVGAFVLEARFGLDRGFDVYDDRMAGRRSGEVGYAERPADQVVDAALAWLEDAPPRFFLWVHFYDPHQVYAPPPGFTDFQLGRLLAALEERFGEGGTLVLATSDHGESLGEHGEPTHSYSLYDATQRVPLLLAGSGVPAARVVETQVRLQDVAPTLLGLAGAEPLAGATGQDLAPLWEGGARAEERVAYAETLATRLDNGWSPLFAVRSGGFKYVRAPRPELYDLAADPRERRNLADADPARSAALSRLLDEHLVGARPLTPDVDTSPEEIARLESLGYVVPSASAFAGDPTRVEGPDPKDRMGFLALIARMGTALEEGRAAEILGELDRTGEQGPIARSLRARAAVEAGDLVRAEREARAALEGNPGRPDFLVMLARALELQGRDAEARTTFEEARVRQPEAAAAHLGLGRIAQRGGDPAGAAAHFERALAAREGSPEAAWRLALLHLQAGRSQEADRVLAGVPAEDLADAEAALTLARAEADAGLEDRARARLQGVLARLGPSGAARWRDEAAELARRLGVPMPAGPDEDGPAPQGG